MGFGVIVAERPRTHSCTVAAEERENCREDPEDGAGTDSGASGLRDIDDFDTRSVVCVDPLVRNH